MSEAYNDITAFEFYHAKLFEDIFAILPVGMFIINNARKICAWNQWMVEKTGIKAQDAIGKTVNQAIPDLTSQRFSWAVEQALNISSPQILSQILNNYLIPIALKNSQHVAFMQQHVEILPIQNNQVNFALVCIFDVTDSVRQKFTLIEMAHKLEEQSYHDALTNIYNRRYLWEWLENHIEQAKRAKHTIACCMYDLDLFKKVNDAYGHIVGDKILVTFVERVKTILRKQDIFVRFGGEEFITLLPHADLAAANHQAKRVLTLLEKTPIHAEQYSITMTCSAGIYVWDPKHPLSANELLDAADKALYKAKNAGRNCIRTYP